MNESLASSDPKREIIDSANLIMNLMRQEFEPLPDGYLEALNQNPTNQQLGSVALSGSKRSFRTENVIGESYIGVSEMYFRCLVNGQESTDRIFELHAWQRDGSYEHLSLWLDSGRMNIEDNGTFETFDPAQHKKAARRILGNLATVANALL